MNWTFSPVLVERFSIRMRSSGTPMPVAMRAKRSASGSGHRRFVITPSPPEKTIKRRPALEEQLRAAFGHDRVVAAEHQDEPRPGELMVHVVIAPDAFHQRPYTSLPSLGTASPNLSHAHSRVPTITAPLRGLSALAVRDSTVIDTPLGAVRIRRMRKRIS